MKFRTICLTAIVALCLIVGSAIAPASAQGQFRWQPLPLLRAPQLRTDSNNMRAAVGCVYLDGRCILELAAPPMELGERLAAVETQIQQAAEAHRQRDRAPLEVVSKENNGFTDLHANIGDEEIRLLTVTALDAEMQSLSVAELARKLEQELRDDLARSRLERARPYLLQQARQGGIALAIAAAAHLLLIWSRRRFQALELKLGQVHWGKREPVSSQMQRAGNVNLARLSQQVLRLLQVAIWVGFCLYALHLFPQTRPLQGILLWAFRIPVRVGLVAAGAWVAARLSFAAIDRFTIAFCDNSLYGPEESWRLRLRLTTISEVAKGVVAVLWFGAGVLVALAAIGIDIGPILAGAGIIGFAVTLASQNLIRDAINGFFIILEDQYGVGDAISLNAEIGGLVENMNLRITQLRDIEGRLITIPNSEIRIVANLSNNWSRSDLKIPLAYHTDADRAMAIVQEVLDTFWKEPEWSGLILEKPEILGIDEFTDRGIILRILIKTQPLKQFPVARESRRRLKAALDAAGIALAVGQERIWLESSYPEPKTDT